jgi:hypothetical protein
VALDVIRAIGDDGLLGKRLAQLAEYARFDGSFRSGYEHSVSDAG